MAFIRRYDRTKPVKKEDPINENIRFKEVLVIDQNGEQLGVMSKRDAMNRAYDAGLDLVCVAPKAKPAVCRIMDYGKYRTLKWLQDGDKVKVAIRFRGRQMAHVDLGQKIMDDFIAECSEYCVVEKPAKLEGRTLTAMLAPKKAK